MDRFNLDPLLGAALLGLAGAHLAYLRARGAAAGPPLAGWLVTAAALMSPLCALSVSLFSARVGQHMILALVAAPLIAAGLQRGGGKGSLWGSAAAFFAALWFWHMPAPYAATFRSDAVYWTMHVTLFGSGVLLWRELLSMERAHALPVLAAGALSSVQMGLLGAIFAMSGSVLFPVHALTAPYWGLDPLKDQQLGGLIMWVPGVFFFLLAAARTVRPFLSEVPESIN